MKVLIWNVQGFASKDSRDNLSDIIRNHNPDIIFLCETKIGESMVKAFIQPYSYPNSLVVGSISRACGLIFLWKTGFPCDVDAMGFFERSQ